MSSNLGTVTLSFRTKSPQVYNFVGGTFVPAKKREGAPGRSIADKAHDSAGLDEKLMHSTCQANAYKNISLFPTIQSGHVGVNSIIAGTCSIKEGHVLVRIGEGEGRSLGDMGAALLG